MSIILNLFNLFRCKQYTKNFFIFIALILIPFKEISLSIIINFLFVFCCFCLLSSAVYIINDLFDFKEDLNNPLKANRALVSGKVKKVDAVFSMMILLLAALSLASNYSIKLLLIEISYLCINLLYSKYLRKLYIIDVISIATGFVLRVVAGFMILNEPINFYIISAVFVLCVILGMIKRYKEYRYYRYNNLGLFCRISLNKYAQIFKLLK